MKNEIMLNPLVKAGSSLHILVLTLYCNLDCVYCHALAKHQTNKKINLKTAKRSVDFAFTSPSKRIIFEFQGGEPLSCFDIVKKIHAYAIKKNDIIRKKISFQLTTNLTLMDDQKANWLLKNNIRICTSLDGPKIVHDNNRRFGKSSSYDISKYWIKKLEGNINALPTITKQSINHPRKIIDTYIELKLKWIHLRFLNYLGSAQKNWLQIGYTSEEFNRFWKKAMDYIIQKNEDGLQIKERGTIIMLKKIVKNIEPNYTELRNPCGAITAQLLYNHNGKIFTCDEARMIGNEDFCIGSVFSDTKYDDIVKKSKSEDIIKSAFISAQKCKGCKYISYCGICPIADRLCGGFSDFRCEIHKFQFEYLNQILKHDEKKRKLLLSWLD